MLMKISVDRETRIMRVKEEEAKIIQKFLDLEEIDYVLDREYVTIAFDDEDVEDF